MFAAEAIRRERLFMYIKLKYKNSAVRRLLNLKKYLVMIHRSAL